MTWKQWAIAITSITSIKITLSVQMWIKLNVEPMLSSPWGKTPEREINALEIQQAIWSLIWLFFGLWKCHWSAPHVLALTVCYKSRASDSLTGPFQMIAHKWMQLCFSSVRWAITMWVTEIFWAFWIWHIKNKMPFNDGYAFHSW